MIIKIREGFDCDDLEWQEMTVDGKYGMSVYPLCDCPEDAIIGRSLPSCFEVLDLMRLAYNAGKNGEEIIVEKEIKACHAQ